MKRLIKTWLFFFVCGGLLAVQPFFAQAGPLDRYIEGAKKEGTVRIGVTLRYERFGKPLGKRYIAAFQKRYPFLDVKFRRIGGSRERERVINEMAGGIYNFDVAPVSSTQIKVLIDAKLATVVEWEKLGVPRFLIQPDNIGVALRTPVFGIGYNRDAISDEEAKTFTWDTCLDPKWKRKSAVKTRPRHLELFYSEHVWGREKTLDYAKRWADTKPTLEADRSMAATKLMSGANHLMCGIPRAQVKDLQVYAGSKTIGIVYPEPIPVGMGDLIYVPDKAKHPNAGILFVAWSASKEGQNLLDIVNFTGHPSFEGNEINKILKGKKIAGATWEDAARADDILKDILLTMGLPVVRSKKKKK